MVIIDSKNRNAEESINIFQPSQAVASTSDQKLSVELPLPKQIYTVGSTITGIVHLENKNREKINEVHVSIICTVRSHLHRYYGGTVHDIRRESTRLLEVTQILWTRGDSDASIPPSEIPFELIMPEFGNDQRGHNSNTPLPPSFHGGRHHGWSRMFTYGHPIGFVKYQIKAKVLHDRRIKAKEKAYAPFVFLPPSSPPPLLPSVPEIMPLRDIDSQLRGQWVAEHANTTLRQGLFNNKGEALLKLWLPKLDSYPRLTNLPFLLCLIMRTQHVTSTDEETEPPNSIIPPPPLIDKIKLHLQRKIRVCARKGVQQHTQTFDRLPADNLVYSCEPEESSWIKKVANVRQVFWEKTYVWQGLWIFKESPNFENRQLHWRYHLVAEIAIKGLTNGVKLVSSELNINTGVSSGQSFVTSDRADYLELPPDYFDIEGDGDNEDEGEGDEDRPSEKESV